MILFALLALASSAHARTGAALVQCQWDQAPTEVQLALPDALKCAVTARRSDVYITCETTPALSIGGVLYSGSKIFDQGGPSLADEWRKDKFNNWYHTRFDLVDAVGLHITLHADPSADGESLSPTTLDVPGHKVPCAVSWK